MADNPVRLEKIIRENLNALPSEPLIWWQRTWWSRGAFLELVEECEMRLAESGFRAGMRIGIIMPNSPMLLAIITAAWKIGGAAVLIDYHARYMTIIRQLQSADVFAAVIYQGRGEIAQLISEEGIPCAVTSLDAMTDSVAGRICSEEASETAAVFFTSGTTGEPHAVPLTHENLWANVCGTSEHLSFLTDDEVFLNALPNSNSMGFVCGALIPLVRGYKQAILTSFMPAEFALAAVKQSGTTIIPAVPMMISLLTAAAAATQFQTHTLRYVMYGNGFLSRRQEERAEKFLHVKLVRGYGLTEASSVVALAETPGTLPEGCVGTVTSALKAEVRGVDGQPLPIGEVGHLWLSGPALSPHALKNGWFDTCDTAKFDENGLLYIIGSDADLISVGGFDFYARDVETVLEEHPAVKECAVTGIKRQISGEVVKAYIVLNDGASVSAKEITDFCRKSLEYYKVPRIVEFVAALPHTATGKIVKRKLS